MMLSLRLHGKAVDYSDYSVKSRATMSDFFSTIATMLSIVNGSTEL